MITALIGRTKQPGLRGFFKGGGGRGLREGGGGRVGRVYSPFGRSEAKSDESTDDYTIGHTCNSS